MTVEARLSRILMETHPEDAAGTLEGMPAEDSVAAISHVPGDVAARVLARMETSHAAACLRICSEEKAAEILNATPIKLAMPMVLRLPVADRERLLQRMDDRLADQLRLSMAYPDGTAGAIMDTAVGALPHDIQITEAVRRVRKQSIKMLYYVFVTDRDHKLVGVLTLRELMQAPGSRTIGEVAARQVESLRASDERSVILGNPAWKTFHALPVIDDAGALVGVLRYETLRMLEAESTSGEPPGLLFLGAALGEAWIDVAALFLDGFAGALNSIHTTDLRIREGR